MKFWKYQGTGNDFIMIDGYNQSVNISVSEVQKLCDRKFGIGADGLIVLRKHSEYDFEMDYFNADGSKSFCGNGSRCAQAFALDLSIISGDSNFLAIDGAHQGKIIGDLFGTKMCDVYEVENKGNDYFVYTGSPHYIQYVNDVKNTKVQELGSGIRYSSEYKLEGTNVNFVEVTNDNLIVRTYERGVEGETLSCGTGVTAVAISYLFKTNGYQNKVDIETLGGEIRIKLKRTSQKQFENIWLIGPAVKVFEGEI